MKEYYRVQAEVHLDKICNNIKRTREIIGKNTKIMAIIKADGYGHGAVPVAKAIDKHVAAYGVAMIEEGIELREAGVDKPILILGYTPQEMFANLVKYNITPAVFSYEMAKSLSKEAQRQNKVLNIHIKVDTGMSRIGFATTEESVTTIKKISELEGINIEGCFTHFARADEVDKTFTFEQIDRYDKFIKKIEEAGIFIEIKHISNSAGIMEIPEANKDMVRSGISTYGLYPSHEVDQSKLFLEPAMEIKTCVSFVKELESGVGISYNSTYITNKKTKVATIPVGYGDGYPRALSSKGRVLINGKSAPIIGRVCMDQFMVDVTHIPEVKSGDKVTLIGRDGEESISVEELAEKAYSFNYEFVCDVGKRIPRVYYYEGKKVGTSETHNIVDIDFK